jgi:hypothetical protein
MAPDGSWYVSTRGIGDNVTPGMNIINQYMGPDIFQLLDERMRANIDAHHGSRKTFPFMAARNGAGARLEWRAAFVGGRHGR